MNQLRGIRSSRRIIDAVRNSLSDLRRFSSAGNGGDVDAGSGETTSQGGNEPYPDRTFSPRRRSRFDLPKDDNSFLEKFKLGVPKDDNSFLEKFKLGVDNVKAESVENPRREEAESPADPPEKADEIFKRMKENGLIPNTVAMLDGLCQDGLVQEAMKLFGLMREKGTIPEVVVYTAVVEGFCKAEKPDDAVRVFRKMQSNGIVANAFSYRVLVQGLCKCKRREDGLGFCLEMLEAGHSPNAAMFVGLVDAACEAKGVEEGRAVIGKLREKGFVLNEKAVREFMDKKADFQPVVWEVIFGKKAPHTRLF